MSVTNTFTKNNAFQRTRILLSVLSLIAIFNSFSLTALANPVIYTAPSDNQSGAFSGEVPVKQIGALLLPKAIVQFKNIDVNVLAVPDWLFDRSVVLAGTLVKAQIDVQDKKSNLHGLVYFSDGLWLSNLGSANSVDIIDTVSGERLRGHIRSRLDNAFAFKPDSGAMQKLSFSEIKHIISPRAYIFTISSDSSKVVPTDTSMQFDANSIAFSPTFAHGFVSKTAKIPKSTLAGTEPGISNAEIAMLVGVNIATDLAPAIAIPLALNPGTRSQAQRQLNYYISTQQRAAGIPVPLNYSSNAP